MGLIPKEEKFFNHFEELVDKIEDGVKLYLEILANYKSSEPKVSQLKEIEHDADHITHVIYNKMHTTFITPLDREDIYALANKMDSILDLVEATAIRMYLYKIKNTTPEIVEMAHVLEKAVALVKKIVYDLKDKKKVKEIIANCVEINTLENEGDYILRRAIAHLFEKEEDPFELIKWKEIYERLEESLDMCEDVSNIVEGIVIKNG